MQEVSSPTLNVVLSGQADMRVANYRVKCQLGDMLYIPAELPMSDGSLPDYVDILPTSCCDILQFSPGLVLGKGLECSIGHSRGNKHVSGSIDERCWVRNLLISQIYAGLCQELETYGNSESTFYLLRLLLVQLQREIKTGKAFVGWLFATALQLKTKEKLIDQMVEYVDDHIEEHLTIDVLARQVGVSRTVLTRTFRQETGDTFKNYLITHRLNLAKVLLKEANIPVNHVAQQVGLSPGRLRGIFKEKYQCTPDVFRRLKNKLSLGG